MTNVPILIPAANESEMTNERLESGRRLDGSAGISLSAVTLSHPNIRNAAPLAAEIHDHAVCVGLLSMDIWKVQLGR